jgi:hypothetical protein
MQIKFGCGQSTRKPSLKAEKAKNQENINVMSLAHACAPVPQLW